MKYMIEPNSCLKCLGNDGSSTQRSSSTWSQTSLSSFQIGYAKKRLGK